MGSQLYCSNVSFSFGLQEFANGDRNIRIAALEALHRVVDAAVNFIICDVS